MVKSRSRSPRWKPGPPSYKNPEYNRHRQDYDHNDRGFHRNSRRPMQWDNERHRQSNTRNDTYNTFNDIMHEQGSIDSEFKRAPFNATSHVRRTYSPERQGERDRRYWAEYNEVTDYKRPSRNFVDHRTHEKNMYNNNEHNNFKAGRRWGNFYRPPNRDRDRDWHENDGHWNERYHPDQYSSPPRRRPEEFEERKLFQKRYPKDDYREYEQPPKRAREEWRHDYQPPQRNSHWKDDHPEGQYYRKDWTKEVDYRHSNTIIHEKQSGHITKIEYGYSQRSPGYLHTEPIFSEDHVSRYNRHEERKLGHGKTSQNHKIDGDGQDRRRYHERSPEPLAKCSSKEDDVSNSLKNDTDIKHLNHKHKDKGRKEEECWKKKDECRKDPISTSHLRPQTPNPKVVLKITPEKEAISNLGLKKSTDKYRQPHEHKNVSKDLPAKSEATPGPRISEGKQVLVDMKKRNNSTPKDRQTSQDLVVVAGKERFHPIFGHLKQSVNRCANEPSAEFTEEIITIVHKVKANHFKSSGMSLHERFSKLQTESNKQELNVDKSILHINPEIHRRIDISLEELQNKSLKKTVKELQNKSLHKTVEDLQNKSFHKTVEELQNKSLHKTVEIHSVSHKMVEDPNDLRHDIERRRKQRLHSDQDGTTNASFGNSDVSGSSHGRRKQEDEKCHSFSKERRPPFQESTGRLPVTGSYHRGTSKQYYTSRSNVEDKNETKKPFKGSENPASRI